MVKGIIDPAVKKAFEAFSPATRKKLYKNKFRFEGNRAILFNIDDKIPIPELSRCIATALTYHLNKKGKNKQRPKMS